MKYAVVELSGSQFKVSEGDIIQIPKLDLPEKKKFQIDKVLLFVDKDKIKIGQPFIKNIFIEATVISHFKGKKVRVFKYKAKSRYRKTKGHRDQLTSVKVEKISEKK